MKSNEESHAASPRKLIREFRAWADGLAIDVGTEVPGASEDELRRLRALGGLAAILAEDSKRGWPAEIRAWAENVPTPPEEIGEKLASLLHAKDDVLATLYNSSISADHRRQLGTVFTPAALVHHMVCLAESVIESPAMVVDPGAGVGAFTLAAANQWPEAKVIASDINPVTLGLLATRIHVEDKRRNSGMASRKSIELMLGDYLEQLKVLFEKADERPILVLGNPPYTRAQSLPMECREKSSKALGELYGNGHANLAMIFQAATLLAMRPQDASCLVLPASFLHTHASAPLRNRIWRSKRIVHVERTPADSTTFKGAAVRAAVLLIGPEQANQPSLKLSEIKLDSDRVQRLNSRSEPRNGESPERWFAPPIDDSARREDFVTLGEAVKVCRGTATGANGMFFIDKATKDRLPDDVVVDGVLSLKGFTGLELTEEALSSNSDPKARRWLLAIPAERKLDSAISAYLATQPPEIKDRYLVRTRKRWCSLDHLPTPTLLVSPLGRSGFKIVSNSLRAVPSNNLLGIDAKDGGSLDDLADWLRTAPGQAELARVARRYPGGSLKLEPGDLKRAQIPRNLLE